MFQFLDYFFYKVCFQNLKLEGEVYIYVENLFYFYGEEKL